MADMFPEELYILSRGIFGKLPSNLPEVRLLCEGDYQTILKSEAANCILHLEDGQSISISSYKDVIYKNVKDFLDNSPNQDDQQKRLFQVLCFGISCLELFIQNNWTGPGSDIKPSDILPSCWTPEEKLKEVKKFTTESLNQEDATIYSLCTHPEFMLLASYILVESSTAWSSLESLDWWSLRCLWFHQKILDDRCPLLYEKIMERRDKMIKKTDLLSKEESGYLRLLFHLECIHVCQYYYHFQEAEVHLSMAKKLAGLEVDLTGALGKRTRFQTEDRAQLFLKVERTEGSGSGFQEDPIPGLPKDLQLDDDTILNHINFKDTGIDEIPKLSGIEQALIISLCLEHKRKCPKDALLNEELAPFVVSVLRQPQYWSIQTQALAVRCQLEKEKRRTVERAMMQMQTLVDGFHDKTCPTNHRMKFIYAANLPPRWAMEKELAGLFISLGSTSAALEVFHRLQLWEDVVECYKRLEKPEKAIRIIQEQLAEKETVLMWCLLGDVTRKKEHYETAWELSNHKSARAQRSLGMYYLREKDYDKCIESMEKSLDRNFLQYGAWFTLGFAALEAKRYETAAKAYRKCVTIEIDNFEAWNNLGHVSIKLNQKDKAFTAFKEALKCNYENWKVWENYLVISVQVGQFSEAIRAYQRMIDLKDKFVDEEILGILARVVSENIPDCTGKPGSEFKDKVAKLFGHLTSKVTNNAKVWELYAQVHGNCQSTDEQTTSKALHFLQNSHRLLTQGKEWFKDETQIKEILQLTQRLSEGYINYSSIVSSTSEAIQSLSSAKLMLKGIIAKCKQSSENLPEIWEAFQSEIADLEERLKSVQELITETKGLT